MEQEKDIIRTFYNAFQEKNYETMQLLYADNASFNDPVFQNLNAAQIKALWKMLCISSKNLVIELGQIESEGKAYSARWKAQYTYIPTGRKITNNIKANFVITKGKIVKHKDEFNFYRWIIQALGMKGLLFGWSPSVKKQIRKQATRSLLLFMKRNA